MTQTTSTLPTGERADLVAALRRQRELFRLTLGGLTDAQAALTPTVSALCLGGLVKHVAATEGAWVRFTADGPEAPIEWEAVDWSDPPPAVVAHTEGFRMVEGETLAGLLEAWDAAAAVTDGLAAEADLDADQPLPEAPWFEPGARWTTRRVLLHLVGEISQHAGHADFLREAIDGQRSMG